MYVVIRRFKVDPDSIDEITDIARNRFLPGLVAIPGFKAFYHLHTGEDELTSVSVFADKTGVEESNRLSRETIKEHLADVMSELEPIQGDVLVEEVVEGFIRK
jgi:heme-degrading monooxygenase HmoA